MLRSIWQKLLILLTLFLSLNPASVLNGRRWRLARSARPHSGQSVMIACWHEQGRVMNLEPVMSNCDSCRTPCMAFVQDHCRSLCFGCRCVCECVCVFLVGIGRLSVGVSCFGWFLLWVWCFSVLWFAYIVFVIIYSNYCVFFLWCSIWILFLFLCVTFFFFPSFAFLSF